MGNIRDEIVAARRSRIASEGHALGTDVPREREVPVVDFPRDPPLICEVKRRSPSRGDIDAALDPVDLVGNYRAHGVRSISVLTEEDYFHGSLDDIIAVKCAYPDCSVLRKDFLVDPDDIIVSYRAGADAVLLIAAVLSSAQLQELLAATRESGLVALVELHDEDDVNKARQFEPELVGINARNLSTFDVDLLGPLRLHDSVDWGHRAVFESGVNTAEDARLVATSGFDAILVGEAVVRNPGRIPAIVSGLEDPRNGPASMHPAGDFWRKLGSRTTGRRPLVKICGITNREDGKYAAKLGADMLGFVFAESPRRASANVVRELADLDVLKAAVVVTGGKRGGVPSEVAALLREGLLDVIQFHGDEGAAECTSGAYPYYRALRLAVPDDAALIRSYGCPRVLVDARTDRAYGGTGALVAPELVRAASDVAPLWLAGGLNDGNIAETVSAYRPELVDASSGLESEPGRKDHRRVARFFKELEHA